MTRMTVRTSAASVVLAAAAIIGACSTPQPEPANLRECLLRASTKSTADAIRAAERICYQLFPRNTEEAFFAGGTYFYRTLAANCSDIRVERGGVLAYGRTGYCKSGSRFERPPRGGVTFTCVGFNQGEESRVYDVERTADGLLLTIPESRESSQLYGSLAGCERSITPEMRQRAKEDVRRAERETADKRDAETREAAARRKREMAGSARACCDCLSAARTTFTERPCLQGDTDNCVSRIVVGDHSMVESGCILSNCEVVCRPFGR